MTTGKSTERKDRINKASMLSLREIISDGLFESDSRTPLRKPPSSLVTPLKSVHRTMEWDLFRFVSGVSLSKLGAKDAYPAGHGTMYSVYFP